MIVTLKKIEAICDDMSPVAAPAQASGGLAWLWSLAASLWLSVRPG